MKKIYRVYSDNTGLLCEKEFFFTDKKTAEFFQKEKNFAQIEKIKSEYLKNYGELMEKHNEHIILIVKDILDTLVSEIQSWYLEEINVLEHIDEINE